ncbi:MAG: hypothetical protein E7412_05750 [Ruminococcaceae bacterium]|nr:hypothetical protein [Oscillospiraceae bacterium]
MRVQLLQYKVKEKDFDPQMPIQAVGKDENGEEYDIEIIDEEFAKPSNAIDNFFAEAAAKDSKRLVICFDREEVSKSLIARRIGESIAAYINEKHQTTTSVKIKDNSFEINIGICARSVIDGHAFSNEDLDKLREYINQTVMRYGIDPITDIEEGYIEF